MFELYYQHKRVFTILISSMVLFYIGCKLVEQQKSEYFTKSFWKEILEASTEQLKMNKKILFKTLAFMLKESDQDDPALIDFVRSPKHEHSYFISLILKNICIKTNTQSIYFCSIFQNS